MWNMKVTIILIAIVGLGTDTKRLVQGLEITIRVEIIQNYNSIDIGQNTEKNPEE